MIKLKDTCRGSLVGFGQAHGVNARQVFALNHFGQVPAERSVSSSKVVNLAELIGFIQDDVQLVVESHE